jgi:hypothetical protein
MKRQIYIVDAIVVDANGAFAHMSGYPKAFDSKNYLDKATTTETAVDIAKKRAEGDMSETFGAMCKVDTRQLQTVTLMTADGFLLESKKLGMIADLPDSEPQETPAE